METTTERRDHITVFKPVVESLHAENAADFRKEFESAIEDGSTVLLDLASVEFIDCAGLGAIVATLRRLRGTGGNIRICNVHEAVQTVFDLVHMHKLVEFRADRDETVAS